MLGALGTVVLPVALVALVGALVGRFLRVDQTAVARLSLYALTPALALDTLLHTQVAAGDALRVVGAYLGTVAVMAVIARGVAAPYKALTRRSVMAAVCIGNNGNFGLPISLFALGQAGFEYSLLVFLASLVVTFTLGPSLYGGGAGARATLRSVLRLPAVWCVVLALALRSLNLALPTGLDRGVHLLSQATLPMVLLSLGLQIGMGGAPRLTAPVWSATALRLLAGPVVALAVAWGLGARGVQLQALVLSAAMPTAVNAFLLAREYAADVETVAATVVTTTLASLLLIALLVPLLPHLP